MRFDALLHVRSALQIGVLVNIGDAVDVTLDVAAFADSLRGIAVIIADHVILACQDRIPDLRAGDDAGDTVVRGAGQSGAAALDQRVAAVGGVVGIAQCAAVAGLAHMAAHRAHGHDNLRDVLRAVVSRQGEAVQDPDIVLLTQGAGQHGDLFHRRTGDFGRPFGILDNAVILSVQVIPEVHVVLQVRSLLALCVKADGIFLQEVPIDDVTLFGVQTQHLMGYAQQQCRIGTGTDGYPFGIQCLGRRTVHRVNTDELCPVFLGTHEVCHRSTGCRPRGIQG